MCVCVPGLQNVRATRTPSACTGELGGSSTKRRRTRWTGSSGRTRMPPKSVKLWLEILCSLCLAPSTCWECSCVHLDRVCPLPVTDIDRALVTEIGHQQFSLSSSLKNTCKDTSVPNRSMIDFRSPQKFLCQQKNNPVADDARGTSFAGGRSGTLGGRAQSRGRAGVLFS